MTPYYHAGLSQPSLFFKKTLFMLSIFARPRPLNRFVLGCHMIVTRSYVIKLEFCNLIGAFTFQYAAILLDQEILRKSPDPFPGGRGLGTRLGLAPPARAGAESRVVTKPVLFVIYDVWASIRGRLVGETGNRGGRLKKWAGMFILTVVLRVVSSGKGLAGVTFGWLC